MLVEEDVYGLLREDAPPPLVTLAPERVLYLTGLSKTVAPGPAHRLPGPAARACADRMHEDEHHTTWYVSTLTMALATRWMNDGTAWRRLVWQRARAGRPAPPVPGAPQGLPLARASPAVPTCG